MFFFEQGAGEINADIFLPLLCAFSIACCACDMYLMVVSIYGPKNHNANCCKKGLDKTVKRFRMKN
jgi:hypothetical protein